ncbi:MAG TPA: TolC family protein, partial [Spirochaetota bacterium]|nr:TolC family protein [Spirochaetota bacterium]
MLNKTCITRFILFLVTGSTLLCGGTLELTLNQFLSLVRENYHAVKAAEFEPQISAASYHELRDRSAPLLTASYTGAAGDMSGLGTDSTNHTITVGAQKMIQQTGTVFSLAWENENATPLALTPGPAGAAQWESGIKLGVVQPLLRGGPVMLQGKKKLDMLRTTVKFSRSLFNTRLQQIILQAMTIYYNCKLTEKMLDISRASIKDAEETLRETKAMVELGTAESYAIYDSQAYLIQSRSALRKTVNDFSNAMLEIKTMSGIKKKSNANLKLTGKCDYQKT